MAIKFTPIYTNEAEYVDALAKSSDLFRQDTYNYLMTQQQGEDYAYALAGVKTRTSDTFSLQDYNLLSGEDQYMYLLNEYYVDKTKTEIDEETGKTYSIYNRNKEYLDDKIQEAIDLKTYESLNGFERFFATIGGFVGNALNELFLGTIEGLLDLGATIVGNKELAAQDLTGVQANREALQRFSRAYTYIDKSGFAGFINDVTTGITKMAPMLLGGAGQAIYFGAMAGNTAEEAIRANPDINYWHLLAYTGAVTGLEFATEKISGKVFGTGKLVGGAKGGNFFTRFALDFASEGFEEAVAEIGDSLLYSLMVDNNAPLASFEDVVYAALVGGMIGGIATTGRVLGTKSQTILKDGSVVDTKTAKKEGLSGEKLSKTKSLFLQESIAEAKQLLSENEVTKLYAKYSKESMIDIETKHADEFAKAEQKQKAKQDAFIKSAMGLSKLFELIGPEGFHKALNLLDYSVSLQTKLLSSFVAKTTGVTAENRFVEETFRRMSGGTSSFTVYDSLTPTQATIKERIKNLYGKNVYFGNLGEQDGVLRRHGLTLDENTIVIDSYVSQTESVEYIMNQVVKEELVHALQFQSGILNAKTLHDLMEQYTALGGQLTTVDLDAAYSSSSDITKISEAQAKALAQTLLFDKFTISRIFYTNRNVFSTIYNWLKRSKETIEALKNRKTNKDKVKYSQLLKCMKTYKDAVAEQIGNEEDANIAKAEMNLSDEELLQLLATYLPDNTNEHYTLLKSEYTIHTQQRMAAEKILSLARADINKTLPFSYRHVFDPEYYGVIKAKDGTEIDFVDAIMSRNPEQDFKYNLQEYMINETGFAINEKEGCLMEVVDYNKVTTQDFDTTCAELQTNPNALNKYTNLSQIFDKTFNEKFVNTEGVNELADIDLKIVYRNNNTTQQAIYGLNPETNKMTVTVFLQENQALSLSQTNNIKHKLFHEITHALADIQGLQNGTSTTYVRSALKTLNAKTINKLAKLLLTEEFYAENKNNTDLVLDNIAYGIYRITDGEYAAEAYASSFTRKGDMSVNLKAGATMNRSGFRTDGLFIYGYGRFAGIELQATTIVRAKQQYRASALRNAVEVVSYSKESGLLAFLESNGVVDFEKAGFNYEFIDAIKNDKLTEKTLMDLFNRNEIGSPEATNIIINWLTRNNPNKNIKTIQDIQKVKERGLIDAIVYGDVRLKNDSQYNKAEPHTYEEVNSFVNENQNLKMVSRTKTGESKTVPLSIYWYSKWQKIYNMLTMENSKANEIILKSDFDFSINASKELLRDLRNNNITSEHAEKAMEPESDAEENGKTSSLDIEAYKQWKDAEYDTGKELQPEKMKRIVNTSKKALNDWFESTDKAGKTYAIKNALLQAKQTIEQSATDIKFSDVVTKEDFEKIINKHINTENWEKIHLKLQRHHAFIDSLFGDGAANDFKKQIRDVYKPATVSKENKLKEIAENITKKKSKIKNNQIKKTVEETVTQETSVDKEQQSEVVTKDQEIKQAAIEAVENASEILSEDGEKTNEKEVRKVEDKIAVLTVTDDVQKKIDALKDALPEEITSDYTGDYTDGKFIKNSNEWIKSHKDLLESISAEDLPVMLSALRINMLDMKDSAAGNLLLRYAYAQRNAQFNTISDWIKKVHQRRTTEAAQQLGNSNALYGKDSVKTFTREMQQKLGRKFEFDDNFVNYVVKSFTGQEMSINDFTQNLTQQLNDLTQQFKTCTDPVEGMEIEDKIEKTATLLDAVKDGDVPAIIDAMNDIQQNEDTNILQALETVDERTRQMVEYMVQHIAEKNGTWVFTKHKSILSDKAQQKLTTLLAGVNSLRFMSMLSNPKTWAKNALSNTLSSTQAIIEDAITKSFEKSKMLRHDDSQASYNGTYDNEFKDYVKTKYLPFIKKATEGDNWTPTEREKLHNEFAKANDPIRKVKILRKIKDAESKMLNDERWTQPRTLRNLTRTLAGSRVLIYTQCWDTLVPKYKGVYDAKTITPEELATNIAKTNGSLAELFTMASSGNALACLRLAEKLKLDIVSTDPKIQNSIFNHSVYRANKLLLKTDNWMSRAISRARRKGGPTGKAVAGVLSLVMPFARISVNSTMYMLDRSPIGLAKGIIKSLKVKTTYRTDMITGIEDYYKSEYSKLLATEKDNYIKEQTAKNEEYDYTKDKNIKNFNFSEAKFNEWAKTNVPKDIQNVISNKKDVANLQKVYDALVEQGKIPPHAIGAGNPFMRAEAFEALAQGSLGTAIMVVGVMLAMLTDAFDYDDDDDYLGPVIRIGDMKIALNDLSPFGSVFVVGAMLGSDNTDNRYLSAFKVFVDSSILSTMDSALSYSDSTLDFFKNQFINTIQQLQPAITKQLAKSVYNTKKDKTGNLFWKTLKTIGSNSLIFNWLVPNKVDPYTGEPERYYESGIIESIFGFVSPISVRVDNKSELEKIAEALGAKTTGLSGRFTINDKDYAVQGAQKEKLAIYRANYIQSQYSKISSGRQKVTVENEKGVRITTTWNNLTQAQKKTVMERIYSDASSKSKIKYWIDSGNIYRTSNQNEYSELKKLFGSGIEYRSNWSKSKFIER